MAQEPATVWTRPERGARGPAALHSRAELTAVAVALADRDGLAAVSMRAVARALGTGQASLYRYVAGRDDLLDLMADAVTGEIDLSVPLDGDPVGDLVALAARLKSVQLRHPWLCDLPPEPLRLGPRGLDYVEYGLRAMAALPLPGHAKMEVFALLNALTAQFTRLELQGGRAADTGRPAAQAAYLAEAVAKGEHPHLAAALAGPSAAPPVERPERLFARTVRRVLTGLLAPGEEPGPYGPE